MTASGCFSLKSDDKYYSSQFQSSDGEEYIARYKKSIHRSNQYGCYIASCGEMTLQWKNTSGKMITVSFYNNQQSQQNNSYLSQNILFVENKVLEKIIIPHSNCNIISVDIKPYVEAKYDVTGITKPSGQLLTPTKREPILTKKLEQLSKDVGNIFQTGNFSDVVLTDGENDIRAHKLLLTARSSVFAKMFQHPMKESKENRITIKDIPIEALKELLHFMYTGTIKIKDSKMARDLYVAADKYDVKDLKDICSEWLKSVDLDSFYNTLLLADLYSDKVLKGAALNYISQNYSQLKEHDYWNTFMKEHQVLAIEILSSLVDKQMKTSK